MSRTLIPKYTYTFLKNGVLESFCDSGCCKEKIQVKAGDTVERDWGQGILLKLQDGTYIRSNKFTVYKLPKNSMTTVQCKNCGETQNLHTNYAYHLPDVPVESILCNECGEITEITKIL